jgi:hypothetical protein
MSVPLEPPPGWSFVVDETSFGACRVTGRDAQGRSVSRHGSDYAEVMQSCIADAWDLFRQTSGRVSYSRE